MSIKTLAELKALWITGYIPTQNDFDNLFDTMTPFDPVNGQILEANANTPSGWSILADGATVTLSSISGSFFRVNIAGNRTMAISTSHVEGRRFVILIGQNAAGGHSVTWPDTIVWVGGSAPSLTATPLCGDIFEFFDDGTKWLGKQIFTNIATTAPGIPTTLATTPVSTTQINLAWDTMGGASSYDVWRDSSYLTSVSTAYYNDTGLTPVTTYHYQVLAKNSYGSSALCTVVDGTTLPPVIAVNYALQFDGSTNYVSIPANSAFQLANNWTIEFWAKDGFQMGSSVSTNGWFIRNEPTSLDSSIMFYDSNGAEQYVNTGYTGHLNDGNWHHVAMVVDPTYLTIYYDGVQVGQATSGTAVMNAAIAGYGILIGADWNFGQHAGTIDEVRISSINRYTGNFTPAHSFGSDSSTVGLWHLDEGTGATTADASGNGNTGTLINSPTWVTGIAPMFDTALMFDGATNFVGIGHPVFASLPSAATYECWMKAPTGSNTGASNILIYQSDYAVASQFLYVIHSKLGGNFGNSGRPLVGTTNICDGQWHHAAFSWDGTTQYLYVDGVMEDSYGCTSMVTYLGTTTGIGAGDYSDSAYNPYTGMIDEVRISDSCRYPLGTTFAPTTSYAVDSNTRVYFKMNENAGTTMITDISGNGNNGVLTNSPTWVAGVTEHDYALQFNSMSECVTVPNTFPSYSAFTAEAWIKSVGSTGTDQYILGVSGTDEYAIWLLNGGCLYTELRTDGGSSYTSGSTYIKGDNTWHHVALVWDGSTKKIFLDGVEDVGAEGSVSGTLAPDGAATIGNDGDFNRVFDGIIDEVRVSNIARYSTTFVPPTYFNTDGNTIALYHFDEGSGTTVHDSSANGHEGTLINNPLWVDGATI